jgi:hypothetical protein
MGPLTSGSQPFMIHGQIKQQGYFTSHIAQST